MFQNVKSIFESLLQFETGLIAISKYKCALKINRLSNKTLFKRDY